MQIIALDIGEDHVNLVECHADSNGFSPRIVRSKSYTFDGRVRAPRKDVARKVVRTICHLGSNATSILVSFPPHDALLHRRVLERIQGHCIWGELRSIDGESATQLVKKHLREVRGWKSL